MRCGAEHRPVKPMAPVLRVLLSRWLAYHPHTWLFVPVANLVPGYPYETKQTSKHGNHVRTSHSDCASAAKKCAQEDVTRVALEEVRRDEVAVT